MRECVRVCVRVTLIISEEGGGWAVYSNHQWGFVTHVCANVYIYIYINIYIYVKEHKENVYICVCMCVCAHVCQEGVCT